MPEGTFLLAFVTLQRWAEFHWDRANRARLMDQGAVEIAAAHYPLLIAIHAGWLAAIWLVGYDRPVDPIYLAAFLIVELGRAWVLWTLGRRWTTRIIILPGAPMIAAGPYRLVKHPNYLIVALEMALVPLALGLPVFAFVAVVLYAGVMAVRIPAENSAIAEATQPIAAGRAEMR